MRTTNMEKRKPKYQGDEIKPILVPRLAHARYEKAARVRDEHEKRRVEKQTAN
jgi:hypothetical protein